MEWKRNSGVNQGHNSGTSVEKVMCKNPNIDLVNMNAYINIVKFCQFVLKILSVKMFFA